MSDLEFIRADWEWDRDFPLSQIVKCGDYLWLSGQIPFDDNGKIVGPNDLQLQSRQVFTNMRRVLARVGCDLTSVVRLTSYFTVPIADGQATRAYWEVRREFFGDHRPASTGMQVAALFTPDMMLEVDAIAFAPGARV